jgi:hypothetical protein
MFPLRATSGSIACAGSTAVDANTSVSASANRAAVSSWVPNVSCVFFLVSRSSRNSFSFPLIRDMQTRNDPSGENTGA